METIKAFPGLTGFYILTSDGLLGAFDPDGKFAVDNKLTASFEEYSRKFLMAYHQNPTQGKTRLAIIHRTQEKRPWGSETLFLEKGIVRRLYPMTGTTELDLTAFQKKNREKSIYRGMEIFLEYKDSATPDMPIYCPVLYDRDTRLSDYADVLDRPVTPADRETPVVEVLNMLAGIPVARRYTPEIASLREKIYQGIVKKNMRKTDEFSLIDNIRRNAASTRSESDPYGDVDKRSDRQVTLEPESGSGEVINPNDSALIQNISSSLMGRPEPATAQTFRVFERFRDLDQDVLEALAGQCMVYKVPPGTKLLERNTNDSWNLYLVDGSVQLAAADGGLKIIESGTPTAAKPVSFLKPRMYTVSAVTRVAFLWIDDGLIKKVIKEKTEPRRLDGTA